uniref:Uncharacterized protein n=1 Tax=Manihot esculenta TaxID=3983 RepID=A0A2C9WH01_MANES
MEFCYFVVRDLLLLRKLELKIQNARACILTLETQRCMTYGSY